MTKLSLIACILFAFLAGAALVLACGGSGSTSDAHVDAACSSCEPPITAERIYRVHDQSRSPSYRGQGTGASCNIGDVLLGGGCWITTRHIPYDGTALPPDTARNDHELIVSGPERYVDAEGNAFQPPPGDREMNRNMWHCIYDNREDVDYLVVTAIAICFDLTPDE